MIIFTDGLKLENKTLEEKITNKQGFKFTFRGKTYTHKDVFASPKSHAQIDRLREKLTQQGLLDRINRVW